MNSDLIMYPPGHARNTYADLKGILHHKFQLLGGLALSPQDLERSLLSLGDLDKLPNQDLQRLYDVNINYKAKSVDDPTL